MGMWGNEDSRPKNLRWNLHRNLSSSAYVPSLLPLFVEYIMMSSGTGAPYRLDSELQCLTAAERGGEEHTDQLLPANSQ